MKMMMMVMMIMMVIVMMMMMMRMRMIAIDIFTLHNLRVISHKPQLTFISEKKSDPMLKIMFNLISTVNGKESQEEEVNK